MTQTKQKRKKRDTRAPTSRDVEVRRKRIEWMPLPCAMAALMFAFFLLRLSTAIPWFTDLAIMALGGAVLATGYEHLRSGKSWSNHTRLARRTERPGAFWYNVGFCIVAGNGILIAGLVKMSLRWFAH